MKTFFGLTLLFLIFTTSVAHGHPLLKGSPASQIKQNQVADKYNLVRIEDESHLETMKDAGLLVRIADTPGIRIDTRLDSRFHYVLSFVNAFLADVGRDFKEEFGVEIQLNSAVRTAVHQLKISGRNRNAAAIIGEKRSVHLTGAAIDIAKLPLTREQIHWLRLRLVALEIRNIIEATEEHYQAVFHIMVFPGYDEPNVYTAKQ